VRPVQRFIDSDLSRYPPKSLSVGRPFDFLMWAEKPGAYKLVLGIYR